MRSLRLCSIFLSFLAAILIITVAGCGGVSPASPPPGSNAGAPPPPPPPPPPPSTSTFVYVNNGSFNNIFVLKLTSDGTLATEPGSPFSDPNLLVKGQSGNFLLGNSASNHLTVYSVNTQTGVPQAPVSSANTFGNGVTDGSVVYTSPGNGIDANTISSSGQLALVPGSPFDPINGTFFTKSYERLQIVGSLLFGSFNTVKDAGNITVFSRSASGALTRMGEFGNGNSPAGFVIHPSASFAYVLTNAVLSLDVYSIDRNTGAGTRIQSLPHNSPDVGGFALDPAGKFLLMSDNGIREFSVDQSSGKLTEVPGSPFFAADNSIHSFAFDPSGRFLIIARQNTMTVMAFNATTGAFTQVGTATTVGDNLQGIQFAIF